MEDIKKNKPPRKRSTIQAIAPQEQLIYVGPNLQGGILSQYTVFRGALPAHIDELVKERPTIKDLIIPISDLSVFISRAATVGTAEYSAYQSAKGVV